LDNPSIKQQGTATTYVIGFLLSIVLTLAAFFLVYKNLLTGSVLIYSIVGLAILQVLIQLLFFLHLGDEPKPYWNTMVFLFMLLTAAIVVIGSIWIMYNLDYNMAMTTHPSGHT